jgi:tetratricopeptide (TPR) repeat protein
MRKAALLPGLLLAIAFPARAQSQPDPYRCFQNQPDADKAIAYCTAAINSTELSHTDHVQAYYNRGKAYVMNRDYDHAIEDYTAVIAANPETQDAHIFSNRGVAYFLKGDYDHAIPDFKRSAHLDPADPNSLQGLSQTHLAKGDYDQAIQDFTEILQQNRRSFMALIYRGDAYKAKGDYDHAVEDYSQVIHSNRKDALALVDRSQAYWRKGDYNNAVKDQTEVIQLMRSTPAPVILRGLIYFSKGDYDLAIRDYDQAARLDANPTDLWVRGVAYYAKGDLDHAIQDLSSAVSNDPLHASTAVLWLCFARFRAGGDALAELKKNAAPLNRTVWPGPAVRFFAGSITRDELLQAAHDPDRDTNAKQACDLNFYLAEYANIQGNRAEALALFRKAPEVCLRSDFLYSVAQFELARLEKLP